MLQEMASVGGSMAALLTAVWGVMLAVTHGIRTRCGAAASGRTHEREIPMTLLVSDARRRATPPTLWYGAVSCVR
jgi:hypothetical protein